jgi:hypothetical protein
MPDAIDRLKTALSDRYAIELAVSAAAAERPFPV